MNNHRHFQTWYSNKNTSNP